MNSEAYFTLRLNWWKKKKIEYQIVDGKALALIRAGEYQVGSQDRNFISPKRFLVHRDILVDVFPVTYGEFADFIRSGGYYHHINNDALKGSGNGGDAILKRIGYSNKKNYHPVTKINWYEASAYARWRGKRLLREKEWEVAAQGSLISKSVGKGENQIRDYLKQANPDLSKEINSVNLSYIGCAYMLASIREWCEDLYNENKYSDDETTEDLQGYRCIKGKSSSFEPNPAARNRMDPLEYDNNVGFRCCLIC